MSKNLANNRYFARFQNNTLPQAVLLPRRIPQYSSQRVLLVSHGLERFWISQTDIQPIFQCSPDTPVHNLLLQWFALMLRLSPSKFHSPPPSDSVPLIRHILLTPNDCKVPQSWLQSDNLVQQFQIFIFLKATPQEQKRTAAKPFAQSVH